MEAIDIILTGVSLNSIFIKKKRNQDFKYIRIFQT